MKSRLERMGAAEALKMTCNHPGCHASQGQIRFEIISRGGMLLSAFCLYGHRRLIQIKTEKVLSSEALKKRKDIWKSGSCETVYCTGYWQSKQGNKRFCPRCQDERDRRSRYKSNLRTKSKRELFKMKINNAARPLVGV